MSETNETRALDEVVTEWLDLKAEREKLDGRIADVTEAILEAVPPGGRHIVTGLPGVGVRVQAPSRRLDVDAAREVLGSERYDLACELLPTAGGVHRVAAGWELDRILLVPAGSKPSVRVL